eukprot:6212221-Pleurochrysis_carterae.AAC.4
MTYAAIGERRAKARRCVSRYGHLRAVTKGAAGASSSEQSVMLECRRETLSRGKRNASEGQAAQCASRHGACNVRVQHIKCPSCGSSAPVQARNVPRGRARPDVV